MVLGERGLERCQGSAGRLNRSPGDEDDEEEDLVDGDDMFLFSIQKKGSTVENLFPYSDFHLNGRGHC